MGNMREKKRCKNQSKKFNVRDLERENKENGKREVTREKLCEKITQKRTYIFTLKEPHKGQLQKRENNPLSHNLVKF